MSFGEGLAVFQIMMLVALGVDRWVHRRELNESTLGQRMATLDKHNAERFERVEKQIVDAGERGSERWGGISAAIVSLQLDMREVKTQLRVGHTHRREHDEPNDL